MSYSLILLLETLRIKQKTWCQDWKTWRYLCKLHYQLQKYLRHCTLFWLKWAPHYLVLVNPPPPLIKLARPCSKLKGTTSNGEKEVGEYFLLQKCDYGSDLQYWKARVSQHFCTGCSFILKSWRWLVILLISYWRIWRKTLSVLNKPSSARLIG